VLQGMTDPSTNSSPILGVAGGALRVALCAVLVLAPTVFGGLHRFGAFDLLFVACLLAGVWVVSSLVGVPLTYPRSWANLLVWVLLVLVFIEQVPLPWGDRYEQQSVAGSAWAVLTDQAPEVSRLHGLILPVGRYSLRPAATLGVLTLVGAAAAVYWLTASATRGRKSLRWTAWAAVLGPTLLAFWVIAWDLGAPRSRPAGVSGLTGPLMILGGDSYVPAMLAGLPLALAATLRLVGWTPRRPPGRRQSRFGWLDRSATVWAGIGVLATAVIALALGMSNVPPTWLVACAAASVVFVLGGYVVAGPRARGGRRPLLIAAVLTLVVVGSLGAGSAIGLARHAAVRGDAGVQAVIDAATISPPVDAAAIRPGPDAAVRLSRKIFGIGAGAISPRATFGKAGWPLLPGDNIDTDGFLIMRAELGWAGLAVAAAWACAMAIMMILAWRRSRAPWTRMAMMAGLGALAANTIYFRQDAAALLAPNLLVLAGVLGVVAAWAAHGAAWRAGRSGGAVRACRMGQAHWPLVAAALGMMVALGVAESNMVEAAAGGPDFGAKPLHFGAFAFICLLLCRAIAPLHATRWPGVAVLGAVAWAAVMGVVVEYGQEYLTQGRTFSPKDMLIDLCGAALVGLVWWMMRRTQLELRPGELPVD